MYVLVSVIMEVFRELRANLKKHATREKGQIGSRIKPPPEFIARMGGRLLLLDWDNSRVAAALPIHTAMGFCFAADRPGTAPGQQPGGELLVTSGWSARIIVLDGDGRPEREFSHRSFNHIHTVEPDVAPDRYLISSSGIDALFAIDAGGRIHWQWWAADHGYTKTPTGELREIDRLADHRPVEYPTLLRTAHPNSVIPDGPDHVLASLFHPGQLVRIERATGAVEVVLDGLDHAHDTRRLADGGVTIANSRKHEILFLDRDLKIARKLTTPAGETPLEWIQGASLTSRGTVIATDDLEIGGDNVELTRGNRIVELDSDTGHTRRSCHMSPDWRLDQAVEIPASVAERYAKTWESGSEIEALGSWED